MTSQKTVVPSCSRELHVIPTIKEAHQEVERCLECEDLLSSPRDQLDLLCESCGGSELARHNAQSSSRSAAKTARHVAKIEAKAGAKPSTTPDPNPSLRARGFKNPR